jgi:hypothetical protein
VRVVAARMHLPWNFRTKAFARTLGERQRVHIRAQARDLPGQRAAHDPDDPGFCDATVFDPKRIEFRLYDCGRALFFEPEFGMTMDVAADFDRALRDLGECIDCEHRARFRCGKVDSCHRHE